jgi:hypothetical protein
MSLLRASDTESLAALAEHAADRYLRVPEVAFDTRDRLVRVPLRYGRDRRGGRVEVPVDADSVLVVHHAASLEILSDTRAFEYLVADVQAVGDLLVAVTSVVPLLICVRVDRLEVELDSSG